MSFAKRSFQVAQLCRRQISTTKSRASAISEVKTVDYSKLKQKQKHFQIDDGVPVYKKGGISDKLLYHVTVGMCAIGMALSSQFVYSIARKK